MILYDTKVLDGHRTIGLPKCLCTKRCYFYDLGEGIFDQYKTNAQTLDQALGN